MTADSLGTTLARAMVPQITPSNGVRPTPDISAHLDAGYQGPRGTVLDPRSFHLFERQGERFLYDVSTGSLVELGHLAYRLLELCAQFDWSGVKASLVEEGLEWDEDVRTGFLDPLVRRGFFRFRDIDRPEQRAMLDTLWAHLPRRIQLLTAQACNLKCVYCYEEKNGSNARKRLMSFEMARDAVDYLVAKSGPRRELQITFFGGEPLLNLGGIKKTVEYCESIQTAASKQFVFELITNGTLLSPDVTRYLIAHRFMLMISIDGGREMNNHNRPSVNGHDYFDTIIRNARFADRAYKRARLGLPVKVRANLTHEHHDLIATARFLESQGFTTIGIATIDDLPWSDGSSHACTQQDLDDLAAQRRQLMEEAYADVRAGRRPSAYAARLLREQLQKIESANFTRGLRCGVGRNTNIIDVDGNMYPCHRYGNLKDFVLGNIRNGGLDKQRTMTYYRAVNDASSTKCNDCWAKYLCGGPCAWLVSEPNGVVHEPREADCDRIRNHIESSLLFHRRVRAEAPELVSAEECGSCACKTVE